MQATIKELLEFDPAKKDVEWARKIVQYMRFHMEPLIKDREARENTQYLLGMNDMQFVKDMFKDPTKAGIKFMAMPVLEKIKNIFTAEIENAGIFITPVAQDPTAVNEKNYDKLLLQNRAFGEALISWAQQGIGGPPFTLDSESQSSDKKIFNGNLPKFDEMSLDPNSSEDLNYFFEYFHRLSHEISAEEAINFCIKYNEIEELLPLFVVDIMAKKAVAMKSYVNEETGSIEHKYVAPESIRVIRGKRRDFKDASAIEYEQLVSVTEFVKMLGDSFNYVTDMNDLLQAVNYSNNTQFTGIYEDGRIYVGVYSNNTCTYSNFLQMSLKVGYIEWKSVDATVYKTTPKNYHGNPSLLKRSVLGEESPNSIYKRKTYYNEVTYKAYYLITASVDLKLYKYGKLCYQNIEGAEDEYSNFSISAYQEIGKSIVDIAKPFIEMIEMAFAKFKYMIIKAKPPGRGYNYEAIVKVAQKMFPNLNEKDKIAGVLKLFAENAWEIYTLPEINGQPVGGGSQVHYEIPNGLQKEIFEFKGVIDWAFEQIIQQIGMSPLREAYSPNPRDVYKLQEQSTEASLNATQYMRKMIMKMVKNTSIRSLLFIQDIIAFKDKSTLPYKWLLAGLGDSVMKNLTSLDKVSLHRYNIFIEPISTFADRQFVKSVTLQAFQNKEITVEQLLLVNAVRSPNKALTVLSYEKRRAERKAMQLQQQAQQGQMQLQQAKDQAALQLEQVKGNLRNQGWDIQGRWNFQAKQAEIDGKLQQQTQKINAEPEKLQQKMEASIEQAQATADIQNQNPSSS